MKDSRILMEWLDANGNQIKFNNTATAAIAKSTKTDFTEKYKKLYTHIKDVWGGLNIIRCAMYEFEIYYGDYYNRTKPWHHLIIRYIPTEGCFEVNLSERGTGVLIYAGEADCWIELLDILLQTGTIKDRKLCEWVDAKGNKITLKSTNTVNVANTAPNKPTSGFFKDKFTKLDNHLNKLYGFCDTRWLADAAYKTYYNKGDDEYLLEIVTDYGQYPIELLHERTKPAKDQITRKTLHDYSQLLDVLYDIGVITDKSLCEWVDSKGNKSPTSTPSTGSEHEEMVYIWDMYIEPRDKGTWCSAELYNGEYDGSVYETAEKAEQAGLAHLWELEDEGELRGRADDYDIKAVAIPKSKVSDYTLKFSGL